jgi:predicted O-methyltransferase YrrM
MDHILMRQDKNGIDGLKKLISHLPDNITGIEIGCYAGESTEIFASSGKFKKLYCVDFWKDGFYSDRGTTGAEFIFDKIAEEYPCIEKIKANSNEIKELFKGKKIDFIYIDGDHEYNQVVRDIKNSLEILSGSGIIAGHDFVPEFPGVQKAIKEIIKTFTLFADSSWMRKIP